MGRGKGGSTSHEKRTPGGIRTSSKMSQVGEIEAKHGVLGDAPAARRSAPTAAIEELSMQNARFQERIANEDKDRRAQLTEFWNKYLKLVKSGEKIDEPDPSVLRNDIERWLLASKRQDKNIKPLSKHKSHVELHDAMKDYRTVAEEKARQANEELEGTKHIRRAGDYSVVQALTPAALSKLASQGTHWCTKDPDIAAVKLKQWDYYVVMKDGKPYMALKKAIGKRNDEVLSFGDHNLYYDDGKRTSATFVEKDIDFVNSELERLHMDPLLKDELALAQSQEEVYERLVRKIETGLQDMQESSWLTMVNVLGNLEERLSPPLERRLVASGDEGLILAYVRPGRRVEEYEEQILDDAGKAVRYCENLASRFPGEHRAEVEKNIALSAHDSYAYATQVLGGRFKLGEPTIAKEPGLAISYATQILHGRFEEAESYLLQSNNPHLVVSYLQSAARSKDYASLENEFRGAKFDVNNIDDLKLYFNKTREMLNKEFGREVDAGIAAGVFARLLGMAGQPVGDESKEGRRGIGSSSAMRSSGQGSSEPQLLYRRLDGWDEDNDDGNSFTEDDERAAYSLARDVNLGITRGRDLMAVMKDNDKVIGAVWTEMDGNEFSFDLAVAPSFQGRGYGNKLTDLALQAADSERSYNDDFRINVQVTSPREKAMLEKRGLVVEQQLPDGSWMMTDRPRIEDPDED